MEDLSKASIQKKVGTRIPMNKQSSGAAVASPTADLKKDINHAQDVNTVKKLLNRVFCPDAFLPLDGQCSTEMVQNITQFQTEMKLTPDGIISPRGETFRKLKNLATPCKLSCVDIANARKGVYLIKHKAKKPEKFKLCLTLSEETLIWGKEVDSTKTKYLMDISQKNRNDVLDEYNDKDFLKLIADLNMWGKPAKCRLIFLRGNYIVWTSNEITFSCVVKPWSGPLNPTAIGAGDGGPPLKYTGNGEAPFEGRYLYKIGDQYYFKYYKYLQTNNDDRGFDCISFIGSLFQLQPKTGSDNPYSKSSNMANALNAKGVEWQDSSDDSIKISGGKGKGKAIKKYFEDTSRTKTYLLWKSSHITIVANKVVSEFAHSANGYKATAVKDWPSNNSDYHLYALPDDKQF